MKSKKKKTNEIVFFLEEWEGKGEGEGGGGRKTQIMK